MSIGNSLLRARYRLIPDQAIGDLLSKPWIETAIPTVLLLLIAAVLGVLSPGLFEPGNLSDTGRQWGEVGLLALGMMVVVLCGGIDLSVGSIYGLATFATVAALHGAHLPVPVAMAVALAVGSLFGLANGMLVGALKMRAFLSTLAVLIIGRSIQEALALRFGASLLEDPGGLQAWYWFGEASILGIPVSLALLLVVAAFTHFVLTRTRLGWHIQAVGGSRRAAYNSGVRISRTVALCYVFSGLCAGMAGFLYSARTANPGSEVGVGFEIIALSAVILGGNSLGGGKGSVTKALLGALTVILVINAMVAMGLRSGATSLALGLTLLCAVFIDARWSRGRDKVLGRIGLSPTFVPPPPAGAAAAAEGCLHRPALDAAVPLATDGPKGSSDVAFDSRGFLYTVGDDGVLLRFAPPHYDVATVVANLGARTMGLAVDRDNAILACVHGLGLCAVSPEGVVRTLADQVPRTLLSLVDHARIRSPHAVDVAADGRLFFSESSVRQDASGWAADLLEARPNGRLLMFDPSSASTSVVIPRLVFPTGVCVEATGDSLLVAEAWACRISRYWIAGPKNGTRDVWVEHLPGFPGGIAPASGGGFWVAMFGPRTPLHDLAMASPGFRRRMSRRVSSDDWLVPDLNAGFVIRLAPSGEIVEILLSGGEDGAGRLALNAARERDGRLYVAGLFGPPVRRVDLQSAGRLAPATGGAADKDGR